MVMADDPPALRAVGLRKAYGDVVALEGLDLEVRPGEFFTMLGPSGSGKTTTLRLIAGFEGTSNLLERNGRRMTVRPEKIRILDEGDEAPGSVPGVVAEVVYLGSVTRYVVDLDEGGTLVALRQNADTSAAEVLAARGRRVGLAWDPRHAMTLEE